MVFLGTARFEQALTFSGDDGARKPGKSIPSWSNKTPEAYLSYTVGAGAAGRRSCASDRLQGSLLPLCLRARREEFTPKARSEFYEALQQAPIEKRDGVRFGRFRILVGDLIEEVERRTSDLAALAEKAEFQSDGEPVLKGTSIEVYRITALLEGGASIEEVLRDYPSVSRKQVEAAQAYAEAYPKSGRPYPRTSAQRALQGAGLQALDDA